MPASRTRCHCTLAYEQRFDGELARALDLNVNRDVLVFLPQQTSAQTSQFNSRNISPPSELPRNSQPVFVRQILGNQTQSSHLDNDHIQSFSQSHRNILDAQPRYIHHDSNAWQPAGAGNPVPCTNQDLGGQSSVLNIMESNNIDAGGQSSTNLVNYTKVSQLGKKYLNVVTKKIKKSYGNKGKAMARKWEPWQTALAMQLAAANVSNKDIGKRLGKTSQAINTKLWREHGGDPKASDKPKARQAAAKKAADAGGEEDVTDEDDSDDAGGGDGGGGDGGCAPFPSPRNGQSSSSTAVCYSLSPSTVGYMERQYPRASPELCFVHSGVVRRRRCCEDV